MKKILFSLLFLLICVPSLWATTYWTAAAGGTTGTCMTAQGESDPGIYLRTVNAGVACLSAGDTLVIKSGIYAEGLIDNIPGGTSWSSPTIIRAYIGSEVIIRPPARPPGTRQNQFVIALGLLSQQYIWIDGLILDAANLTTVAEGSAVIWADGGSNIKVTNSELRNALNYGFGQGRVSDSQGGNILINLKVHDTRFGNEGSSGIYLASSDNLIERCEIYNVDRGIALLRNVGGPADNNIVRSNILRDGGGSAGTNIIAINDVGSNNIVYNNLIYNWNGNPADGAMININAPSGGKYYNNTIYNTTTNGIWVGAGSGAEIKNNIVYLNRGTNIIDQGTGTVFAANLCDVTGTGCTTIGDPMFVDAATRNFHLQSTSAAIDVGVTVPQVPVDFDGIARPQGAAYDIGAYEFVWQVS